MSELKEHLFCECDECIREYRRPLSNEMRPYYLKSEADKVIAELKEIDSKNRSAYYKDLAMMAKDVEHHKYKRCLAMAKWCRLHDEFTQLESERLGLQHRAIFLEYRRKAMWWNKWRKRWLELADKFKEEK